MYARAVGAPTWKKKPPARQFPAMNFPAMCKPSQHVQHVWVHTTPTVILACVIGWQVCTVAACGTAMYHSIEVYEDDLPLSAVHLLLVCFVSIDRCLSVGLSTAICSGSRGSRLPSSCEILRTVYSKGWASKSPPTQARVYRSKGSPVRSKSIAHIAHFRPLR